MDVWSGHHLPISFQYHAMQQEEKKKQNKRKNNQNTWISHKKARLHGACKLHYEKEILQEETAPSTLVHPMLSHLKFPSQKLSLSLGDPLEPLKSLTTAVQEPPAPSLSAPSPLSLFNRVRTALYGEKPEPLLSVSSQDLF